MRRGPSLTLLLIAVIALAACVGKTDGPLTEIRIPRGAGGVGFLPLLIMEKNKLVEKHAAEKGLPNLQVRWIELGGPSVMNVALLSGEVDFILKCVARDLSAFQSFITNTVTSEKNVASVKSSLVIHASKQEPGYPIHVPA